MKNPYVLQQDDFDALLGLFSGDREEAGETYESLRDGLIQFFRFKGCSNADDLADETLNRVASKAGSFDPSKDIKPSAYIYGFAYNILLENFRKVRRNEECSLERDRMEEFAAPVQETHASERRYTCLKQCLGALSETERDLIIEYYSRERQEKIELRKVMAARLGCRPEVLHTRIFRIKAQLRGCVLKCIEKSS